MTTAFQTGPGFYAAQTAGYNPQVPKGHIRVYCVRMEAYDLEAAEQADMNTNFELLFAKAEGNPELAKAILHLGEVIHGNRWELRRIVKEG